MIVIKIYGGLGNQMFQYAFGKALSKKNNTNLYLDLSWFEEISKSTIRKFQLDVFNTEYCIADQNIIKVSKPLKFRLLNSVLIKLKIGKLQISEYFVENTFAFNNSIGIIGKNCYVNGYWQSQKYFNEFFFDIRSDFTLKSNLLYEINHTDLTQIQSCQSIAVHIRRSDYSMKNNKNIHGILPISYYEESMIFIEKNVKNAVFFIFSDDLEWAKKAMNNKSRNIHFITKNSNYIDLYLNSQCKHNVIANSSFSWWGAWLNQNPNKIVIAPKNWFIDKKLNDQVIDLIPDSWKRM